MESYREDETLNLGFSSKVGRLLVLPFYIPTAGNRNIPNAKLHKCVGAPSGLAKNVPDRESGSIRGGKKVDPHRTPEVGCPVDQGLPFLDIFC